MVTLSKEERAKKQAEALKLIPFGFVGGKELKAILDKGPSGVTEDEKAILRSRITYLTEQQIEDFGLEEKSAEETPASSVEEGGEEVPPAETPKEKKAREKAEKEAATAKAKADKEAAKAAKEAAKKKK